MSMNEKLTEIARNAIVESLTDPETAKELIGSAVSGILDLNNYQTTEAIKTAALSAVSMAVQSQVADMLKEEPHKTKLQKKVAEVLPDFVEMIMNRAIANFDRGY